MVAAEVELDPRNRERRAGVLRMHGCVKNRDAGFGFRDSLLFRAILAHLAVASDHC